MKTTHTLLAVLMLITCFSSCKNDDEQCGRSDLRTLSFGFESSLEEWLNLGGNIEAKYSTDVAISAHTARQGSKSVMFSVSPDSYINGGNRAELSFDQLIESGDVTHYAYSVFIPADYQDVGSLRAGDGAPNWQILGQWHDQPDVCIGQTWNDIEGNSPPIAIYYNYLTASDPEYVQFLSDPDFTAIFGVDTTWDNTSILALEYGGTAVAIHQVNKGEWVDLKFDIKWSEGNDGYIQAWIDNNAFTNGKVSGSNMLNSASHYFKFGLYRNPTIPYVNKVYYDDIKIY